ncbi:MAG: tetratricopeptide repeat protein [Spirochaetes bacterium]|nr:tetratricopeptide repeat protein [Spirochaetota bacterium]
MSKLSLKRLFSEGIEAGGTREYGRSIEIFTRIVAETDEFPEALLYLGRAHHVMGNHEQAIQAFRQFIDTRLDPEAGFFFLGRSYLSVRRFPEALQCFRKSMEAGESAGKPARAESHAFLGIAWLRMRRPGKALEALERAVTIAPDDMRIFAGYRNALFVNSVRLLSRGEADMTAQMLGFVIANGGDGVSPRLYRSRALRTLGRISEAVQDVSVAREFAPDDPAIVFQLVVLLLQAGRTQEAASELDRIGRQFPDFPAVEWNAVLLDRYRAFSLLKNGDPRGALAAALDILRGGARDSQARMIAAEAYRELGQNDRAINHFTRALEIDPSSPDLLLGRADAYRAAGDIRSALSDILKAERAGADPSLVLYYGTICRARLGDSPAALLPKLQALVREHPTDPNVLFALGESLYKTGRPDLARGWFEKTLALDPDDEMSLLYLVSVAESIDGPDAIGEAYDRYLERHADNAAVRREYIHRLVALKDFRKTAQVIERGTAFAKPGPKTLKLLAFCKRRCRRWREAAILYRGLLRSSPEDEELLLGLALCLDKSGARDTAAKLLEKGASFTKSAGAYLALGRLRVASGSPEKAIEAFRAAAGRNPADPVPLEALAAVYGTTGPASLAIRYAEEAARLRPAKRERT